MSLIATAPASSTRRATSGENVSASTGTPASAARRSTAGTSLPASASASTGGPLRAASAPTSSMSKPASTSARPSATARSGVPLRAPAKNESSVTLTIPATSGRPKSSSRSVSRHTVTGSKLVASMGLSCVYTDLDGTLLGPRGSLFRGPDGYFSINQAKALQACDRAGVEVVIMSGRRESTVRSDARLLGQTSYIYEAGCAVMIDDEPTYLTGDWVPDSNGRTPAQRMLDEGIVDLLFERFAPLLEWHSPWHHERVFSHLFRGGVDVAEANALLREHGHDDLRFLDNGTIARPVEGVEIAHAYHLVPGGASKAKGVAFHMQARGYDPEDCIAIGDSIEDLESAESVGRFFVVANGPERDPALREALARFPNASVTDAAMGDGFYEAVVSTLAMR